MARCEARMTAVLSVRFLLSYHVARLRDNVRDLCVRKYTLVKPLSDRKVRLWIVLVKNN